MIILSDVQTQAICNVTRLLQPHERQAFMAALFEALLNGPDALGGRSLASLLKDLQPNSFPAPAEAEDIKHGTRARVFSPRV
jgi:hypothetical protein